MKTLLLFVLMAAAGLCRAQALLEFRNDLAFDAATVNAVAERAYRARLQALEADGRLDGDAVLIARLRHLINVLQPAAIFEHPDAAVIVWEIHTCRRCDENAAAMAGGRLLVGEEFIARLAPSDDELAYMLAHEMAHVLSEHTREFATTARFFLGNGRNREYEDIQNELDESIGANLRMAPVYAQQELDADYAGFILGARSGFDPAAMPRMLRKLHIDAARGLISHPDERTRFQQVAAMLPAAQSIQAASSALR